MSRLGRFLGRAQQVGSQIGAYKNIGWLALLIGGVAVVVFRYAAGMGVVLLAALSVLLLSAAVLLTALVIARRWAGPGYRWISAEYEYRFANDDLRNQTQLIRIRIRATRNNVCCFENSYYWSGTGDTSIQVNSAGHRYVGEVPADDSKRMYWIHLDSSLNRGDETEIEVEQSLFDERRSLKPMLTKRVSGGLGALTLKAVFPQRAVPKAIVAREMTYSKKSPHWREAQVDKPQWQPDEEITEISYSPLRPRKNYRYELKWDPWDVYNKPDISP